MSNTFFQGEAKGLHGARCPPGHGPEPE